MKRPPTIIVQLVHLQGPMKGEIQEFTQQVITIGRLPESLLRFPKDLGIISRKHAEIIRDGNRFKVVDFSTNGTFVNGKRVQDELLLKNGDVLAFAEGGPKVSFLMLTTELDTTAESGRSPSLAESPSGEGQEPVGLKPEPSREPEPPSDRELLLHEVPVHAANVPLVCQYGPTLRSFKQLPVTIGKHPSCQLNIDHPAILDMHAQIFYNRDQYWIKDLTGRESIRINGEPIKSQAPLKASDVIALSLAGPFFRFLGDGRLAEEILEGSQMESERTGEEAKRSEDARHETDDRKGEREKRPFLKRFIP